MDPGLATLFDVLKVAGLVAIAAGVFGLVSRYGAAQAWKQELFWVEQIAAIKADPSSRIVMQLLELDGRRVDLFPHEQDYKKRFWVVTHGELAQALRPHRSGERFEEVEARLRDIFDELLEHFERLDELADRGLVERDALVPQLAYWFDAILRTRLEDPDTEDPALLRYIVHYGFDGTRRLLEAYEAHTATEPGRKSKLALGPYVAPARGHRGWRIAREERKAREIRVQQASDEMEN